MNDLKLASEISRIIWGYTLGSFSINDDDVPPDEIAFAYSIYHYAVLDILKRYDLNEDVLEIFIPSAGFLYQVDPNQIQYAPTFGIMAGEVTGAIQLFEIDRLNPSSAEDARKMLSKKFLICTESIKSTYESFCGFQPNDSQCVKYVRDVHSIRNDVEKLIFATRNRFSQNKSYDDSEDYQYKPERKQKFALYLCWIVIAAFIIYGSYYFFLST